MNNELLPLVRELCYIANTRNEINLRRHRARYRKNYYAKAIKVVKAHTKYKEYSAHRQSGAKAALLHDMEMLRFAHPNPKKWLSMGLHKLRSLQLKAVADNAQARHEAMELSLKTTTKVKKLLKDLNATISYDNGSIYVIRLFSVNSYKSAITTTLNPDDMKQYAKEHELNIAVNDMLKG